MPEPDISKNIRECPACHKPGEGKFCMYCGEEMKPDLITVRSLFMNIPDLFDIEHGLFYTIKTMFYRPGRALRRYFAGDRIRHYKPIKYVLFLGTISTIINAYVADYNEQVPFYSEIFEEGVEMDKLMNDWNTVWFMLGFPILALVSWRLYRKRPYTFGEHIVANAFLIGQFAFISILITPLFLLENESLALRITQIVTWLLFFYYVYAYYDWFYGLRTIQGIVRSFFAVLLCAIIFIISNYFIIVPAVYYLKKAVEAIF